MSQPATGITFRIFIDRPVPGVAHSLQSKDGLPLDPKVSRKGEALVFDFPVRVLPGPKFSGDQVRREGKERRFVYIRIGQLAGDASSPWSRRMKVDIHDTSAEFLEQATQGGKVIEIKVFGTAKDGTPACATVDRTIRLRSRAKR